MPSLAEAVAADKDALADYLATTEGLRAADNPSVTVASAALDELTSSDIVILGDVTVPQASGGLQVRAGSPTLNGWVIVQRPEGGEAAIRETRRVAAAHMGRVELAVAAVNADPAAAGVTALQGSVRITTSGMQEGPSIWQNQAARQAQIPFSISWTSHTT